MIESYYELPGKSPDDTEALVLAIDHSKAVHEVTVDLVGDYQQQVDSSLQAMADALALERLVDLGYYHSI